MWFGRAIGLFLEKALPNHDLQMRAYDVDDLDRVKMRISRWENSANSEDPRSIRDQMKKIMQNSFGVFRDQGHMESALKELYQLSEQLQHAKLLDQSQIFNTSRIEAYELDNLMATALATARGALARTESRGAHSRYDYPHRDDENWLKHSLYFADGRLLFRAVNQAPKDIAPFPVRERD